MDRDPLNQGVSLYRGKKSPSAELRDMVEKGRAVQRGEKDRRSRNRKMYRLAEEVSGAPGVEQVRNLTRDVSLKSGRKHDKINRARRMIDSKVALLAGKTPPLRNIKPTERDVRSIEGARVAGLVLEWFWVKNDVQQEMRNLVRYGEIDGVGVLGVIPDADAGEIVEIPFDQNGEPIMDRNALEGWNRAGMVDWKRVRLGDVSVRAMRSNNFAFDPNLRTHWRECRWVIESRIWPKDKVEAAMGIDWDQAVQEQERTLVQSGGLATAEKPTEATVEDDDGSTSKAMGQDACVVHELFALPHGDWPEGAHIIWADKFPDLPWTQEPWDEDLPYRLFIPRPDGGHLLRSLGTMDDLGPIQVRRDRLLSLQHDYTDMVARPPAMVPRGSMRDPDLWNDKRLVEYHAPLGEPKIMNVPTDGSMLLTQQMDWHTSEMEEIAGISAIIRGMPVSGAADTAAQYAQMLQQGELNMSESQENLKRIMEWCGQRILEGIQKHYHLPRKIALPGVEDTGDLASFQGAMIEGNTEFRIDVDLMPRSRGQMVQTIFQLAPVFGEELKPYLGDLIAGDPDAFLEKRDDNKAQADEENQMFVTLAKQPIVQQIWADFEKERAIYMAVVEEVTAGMMQVQAEVMAAQEAGEEFVDTTLLQYPDAKSFLAANGLNEPSFIGMLQDAEKGGAPIDVPRVEDWDDDPIHMEVLNSMRRTQSYRILAKRMPWYEHMMREHYQRHRENVEEMVDSAAMLMGGPQPGSAPKELGTASQPAQSQPTPGAGATTPELPAGG